METSLKKERPFRFIEFSVYHRQSSMKVGIDAVLIGAWGEVEGNYGLDIGCGCGILSLMAAQRNKKAEILALDIDDLSVSEAQNNFNLSPWKSRLKAIHCDVNEYVRNCKPEKLTSYDFIISNPPFFSSGIITPTTRREKARHSGSLSPQRLIEIGFKLLKEGGTLSMIMDVESMENINYLNKFNIEKICSVANKPLSEPKRIMLVLKKTDKGDIKKQEIKYDNLYIRDLNGDYSQRYKELTKEFYLKGALD